MQFELLKQFGVEVETRVVSAHRTPEFMVRVCKDWSFMMDKIFGSIEWYFEKLKETKGSFALNYKDLNLNNVKGIIWSLFMLAKLVFTKN